MAIENAAERGRILAGEFRRSGTEPHTFAEISGIPEDRLELLQEGAWEMLTLREIAVISEALDVDLSDL